MSDGRESGVLQVLGLFNGLGESWAILGGMRGGRESGVVGGDAARESGVLQVLGLFNGLGELCVIVGARRGGTGLGVVGEDGLGGMSGGRELGVLQVLDGEETALRGIRDGRESGVLLFVLGSCETSLVFKEGIDSVVGLVSLPESSVSWMVRPWAL